MNDIVIKAENIGNNLSKSFCRDKNCNKNEKVFWADNLRVIATVGVITLHVSARLATQYGSISPLFWWVGNIYDSSVRFCVPIFVMLTGSLLLTKNYKIGDYFKKRLFRVIIPLAFWSLVYILGALSHRILHDDKMTIFEIAKYFIVQIRDGSAYHLWYVYMIIGIMLFIPIIGKWVRNCSEKEIIYFLVIWLCTLLLNQPIISKIKPNIDLTYFTGYIGYLILGYYLTIKSFDNKKINVISICLIVLGITVTIFGTYFASNYTGGYCQIFYNYLTPNILIVSIGIFVFFKNFYVSNSKIIKIRDFISKYSYGIYLIHILVLGELAKLNISGNLINPIIGVPFTTILCLIISGGIIYFVNKLPYGKYISG
jgi:surface polysaccharide O-acyltransferase-like enzyme